LDFYTEVQDLGHLVAAMGAGPFSARFRKLSAGLADVVQEFGLLAFAPLAIQVRARPMHRPGGDPLRGGSHLPMSPACEPWPCHGGPQLLLCQWPGPRSWASRAGC
jgi:hypothetical protein